MKDIWWYIALGGVALFYWGVSELYLRKNEQMEAIIEVDNQTISALKTKIVLLEQQIIILAKVVKRK
jgi:hypothetical protein